MSAILKGDYTAATLLFNLQILPETLMMGIVLLAIILANQSLVILALSAGAAQLLTRAVGTFIMRTIPGTAVRVSSLDQCRTGFVSQVWDSLLRGNQVPERLWHPLAPSLYLSTIGFFVGYGLAIQTLYKDEINANVMSRSTLMGTWICSVLLLILAILFRIYSTCESVAGALFGTLFGLVLGYAGCITLGYVTDRRATNVWGIPLLRDRINNGSAVYVCPPTT